MEKLIYLLGDAEVGEVPKGRRDLRDALLRAAPALERAGAKKITFSVADVDEPYVEEIAQFNNAGLLDAQLSFWLDSLDDRAEVESVAAGLASRYAGYLVTESILRDYSDDPDNNNASNASNASNTSNTSNDPVRDWKPGEPSPGIALVTTFPKPDWIDDETFYARWHGSHGPLSLELHPLTRYVRNSVARVLTPGAPPFRAIVSESVASAAIAIDVDEFYSGRENRKRIVKDLLSFAEIETMSTTVMREYILEA